MPKTKPKKTAKKAVKKPKKTIKPKKITKKKITKRSKTTEKPTVPVTGKKMRRKLGIY